MSRKSRPISVFAVVSCIVYILTTIESSSLLGTVIKGSLKVFINNKVMSLTFPNFEIIFSIILSIIALRLYLHAWAVDESIWYEKIKGANGKLKLFVEWITRISWVLMVTYIPSAFANQKIWIVNIKVPWEVYFMTIFILLIFWDLLMIDSVIKYSNYVRKNNKSKDFRIKELKKTWYRNDWFLVLLTIFACVIKFLPINGEWLNYKPFFLFIILTAMAGISISQLLKWGAEIYHSSFE